MLLPKLLQALNDDASTRQEFVSLILEDPALAGNVWCAPTAPGIARRRSLSIASIARCACSAPTDCTVCMATAILQPVFRVPRGYFDNFARSPGSRRSAPPRPPRLTEGHRSCDPFVAQLLGVLAAMSRIVLFRLTMDVYRDHPNMLPRAEVFIRSMQAHAHGSRSRRADLGAVGSSRRPRWASSRPRCRRPRWGSSAAPCTSETCAVPAMLHGCSRPRGARHAHGTRRPRRTPCGRGKALTEGSRRWPARVSAGSVGTRVPDSRYLPLTKCEELTMASLRRKLRAHATRGRQGRLDPALVARSTDPDPAGPVPAARLYLTSRSRSAAAPCWSLAAPAATETITCSRTDARCRRRAAKLMGASGRVPGALRPEDVPAALQRLESAAEKIADRDALPPLRPPRPTTRTGPRTRTRIWSASRRSRSPLAPSR